MIRLAEDGQAILEFALLAPCLCVLLLLIVGFGLWFTIHIQLLSAVREGALLYSGGHAPAHEVVAEMQRVLADGFPSVQVPSSAIYVGRSSDAQATRFQIDRVRIQYRCVNPLVRLLFPAVGGPILEESCFIKHAPSYMLIWMVEQKPPVPW